MIGFTKWPRLIVTGQPVSQAQANEILIRTDGSYGCNDKAWETAVKLVLGGGEQVENGWSWLAIRERLRMLDLEYLSNHRIMDPSIGGPHGWCDWDGRIGCGTYNIGKWPTCDQVTAEWERIAAAFPFLRLDAQVITQEGEGEIAAQWAVDGGKAALVEPAGPLPGHADLDGFDLWSRFFGGWGERGVGIDRLHAAVEQVRTGGEP